MEQLEPEYLLIVGCSQRKRCAEGKIPALERYDGPMFRMLRKFQHDFGLPSGLKILIPSARYGLIQADKPISNYDLRMTRNQATLLFPEVTHSLEPLSQLPIAEAYIDLGVAIKQQCQQISPKCSLESPFAMAMAGLGSESAGSSGGSAPLLDLFLRFYYERRFQS